MNNKYFEINKSIALENDTYDIKLIVSNSTICTEKVTVVIFRINETKLYYTYETTRYFTEENRYSTVVQEAIQGFKDDKLTQQFINWDGKLKYKISL
jgi:hypothetical protein